MKLEFEAPLTRGRKANPRDVRRVKRALGCWGYYTPDPIVGVTGEMDEGCWKALHAFQRAHMIPFADTAGPGSVTERVLNEELAALEAAGAPFVWRTADDDKVRHEHALRSGRVFTFDNPPDGELPGEDYNCRCWAEPLNPSRHPLAEEARRGQIEALLSGVESFGFERNGLGRPENIPLDPMVDAINPTIGPFEILAGAAVARVGGGAIVSTITRALANKVRSERASLRKQGDDPVFKKPEGIPDDWVVTRTENGTGVQYTSPGDKSRGTYVKIEKGKPNNSMPGQKYDNVRWQKNGQSLDVNGNSVQRKSLESHIPLKDFKFNPEIFK
jgi:hypothetical protein